MLYEKQQVKQNFGQVTCQDEQHMKLGVYVLAADAMQATKVLSRFQASSSPLLALRTGNAVGFPCCQQQHAWPKNALAGLQDSADAMAAHKVQYLLQYL